MHNYPKKRNQNSFSGSFCFEILQTPFAAIFLPCGKSDIKAVGFCDIIFVLIHTA